MELKIWIYIIIGVIYLIRMITKKSASNTNEVPDVVQLPKKQQRIDIPKSNPAKPKPLTFEELLREISETKKAKEPYKPQPKPAYVDYDDDIEEEAKSLEQIPANYRKKDKIYDVYEDPKKQAFTRPSLEETMKLQDTDTKYARFKIFEQEDERNYALEEYTRDFQDPEGFKKAFVMSEILKTKF